MDKGYINCMEILNVEKNKRTRAVNVGWINGWLSKSWINNHLWVETLSSVDG